MITNLEDKGGNNPLRMQRYLEEFPDELVHCSRNQRLVCDENIHFEKDANVIYESSRFFTA